ncbi:glycosyltransferase [Pararhizobium gei]|uniref:glycosyltransferase n=1 Tax=Pararhizobium gei TaxID=1395951 RepID=UPI0023DA3D70|nr:glycosyltransferase [Rhizobium gei]
MSSLDEVERLKGLGRWLEASAVYASLLESDIESSPRWVQLGHMLKEGGASADAEFAYRSAIRADGTDPDPRLHLAHLLKNLGRLEEALTEFEALDRLPHETKVSQEIAGLRVALAPENRQLRPASADLLDTVAKLEPHRSSIDRLKSRQTQIAERERDALFAETPTPAKPSGGAAALYKAACGRRLDVKLVPKANLIVRNGTFIATTPNPRFDLLYEDGGPPGGWIEIEFGIEGKFPSVDPILYVEHSPHWQAFSFYRLSQHDGRFYALCLLTAPVLSMRLDPVQFEGAFKVTVFQMKQRGLPGALRAAWRIDRRSARAALSSWRTHRRLSQLEDDISNILAFKGPDLYQRWIGRHGTPKPEQIGARQRMSERWSKPPRITVLIPFDLQQTDALKQSLLSLSGQIYRHFKVQFITAASSSDADETTLSVFLEEKHRLPPVDSLPAAIAGGDDDFMLMLEPGSTLAPGALFAFAEKIVANPSVDLLYGDEDSLEDGRRCNPLFKPDWDPDYEAATGYLGNFVAIRCNRLKAALEAAPAPAPHWFDLTIQTAYTIKPHQIVHIAAVLGHMDSRLPSIASRAFTAEGQELLAQAIGTPGIRIVADGPGLNRIVRPEPPEWPHVTLIVPTRDRVDLLRQCLHSLLSMTAYPSFDIIIVDNDSSEPETLAYFAELGGQPDISVLPVPGPFNFSALNNAAVQQARGSIVGLVNNDIVAVEEGWLKEMVLEAARPEIGAVGAKLLYRSGHVQHAGFACGIGLVGGHPHKFRGRDDAGYMMRLAAAHRVSAVTAACLIVEKRKYLDVGGLDESLAVAFNDLDFCLKLGAAGYFNLFTPRAQLIHLESVTRGLDTTPEKEKRYRDEASIVLGRWSKIVKNDPYYNINLTREREDYSIGP